MSGFALAATSFSFFRPSRLPISASVDRSGSESRTRVEATLVGGTLGGHSTVPSQAADSGATSHSPLDRHLLLPAAKVSEPANFESTAP